ncbi:hypothetical protein BKH22_08760 [Actinomyces oris]|nr:YeeE/YedE thiosulfate transporter family protein [Actinomyces oris]OLO63488.1 hypothetical protein BKH22_08760 [Actinomyces oris]
MTGHGLQATGVAVLTSAGSESGSSWPTSWASGRPDGLGITTSSSTLVNLIVTGEVKGLDWGVLLVLGIQRSIAGDAAWSITVRR